VVAVVLVVTRMAQTVAQAAALRQMAVLVEPLVLVTRHLQVHLKAIMVELGQLAATTMEMAVEVVLAV
jgi:hypothetical protein